jgi:AraC family transcriptional regulator
MVVKAELEKAGLHPAKIELGEVELQEDLLSATQLTEITTSLEYVGFELIDDRKGRIIEKIRNVVVTLIHNTDEQPKEKYSERISKELHYDYPYLSKLFSGVAGVTIEQYIIQQKVEKIKEYLVYDELSLSEIADRMGYSSVAHLSAQFKKITGLPPSHFKNISAHERRPLDEIGTK